MKFLQTAKTALARVLDVEKRKGVFVSRRLLNADEWHRWGAKWKVPNLVPADEMHVTVVYSPDKDVKMKPATDPLVIDTKLACFALFGPEEDVLVVAFCSWRLSQRHWEYRENGATSTWPTYRPHMTLSYDIGDFELSDEAVADSPEFLVLGAEASATPKDEATADEVDPEGVECDEGMDAVIVVIEIERSAATELLESEKAATLAPWDETALREIAAGHPISRGVAKRLSATDWAPDAIKAMATREDKKDPPKKKPAMADGETKKTRDVEIVVRDFPAEIRKNLADRPVVKFDDAERIIYGIASVSTVDGELIEDHHGAKITTDCLREFIHDIIRGQRAGKFEHEGEVCNEVVEGFVLSDDIQKSLGISLGYEPLLIGMHVPGDKDWQAVCDGDWMFSIAGSLYYVEEGAEHAEAA